MQIVSCPDILQLSDMFFSLLGLHPTVLIPKVAPTPRYTEPSSPVSLDSTSSPAFPSQPEMPPQLELPADFINDHGAHERRERIKLIARTLIRFVLPAIPVIAAIVLPSFESLLSLLGSGFAVVISILLPIAAKATVFGWKKHEIGIFLLSAVLGTIGVVCTFL